MRPTSISRLPTTRNITPASHAKTISQIFTVVQEAWISTTSSATSQHAQSTTTIPSHSRPGTSNFYRLQLPCPHQRTRSLSDDGSMGHSTSSGTIMNSHLAVSTPNPNPNPKPISQLPTRIPGETKSWETKENEHAITLKTLDSQLKQPILTP